MLLYLFQVTRFSTMCLYMYLMGAGGTGQGQGQEEERSWHAWDVMPSIVVQLLLPLCVGIHAEVLCLTFQRVMCRLPCAQYCAKSRAKSQERCKPPASSPLLSNA